MDEPTILIIGAGVFGASTAYHLSHRYADPTRITIVDTSENAPADVAASSDINKIIRDDYSSAFYCELAHDAIDAWRTWPELKQYYHNTGWIMLDEQGSDLAERIRRTLGERGWDNTADVPLRDLESKWGGVLTGSSTDGFQDAYWNPDTGWCNAAEATSSIIRSATNKGVQYLRATVSHIFHENGKAVVETSDGSRLAAQRIVLATGAWTSSLMSAMEDELDLAPAHRVESQVTAAGVCVSHYKMSAEEMDALADMPVVVYGTFGEVIPPPARSCLLKYTNARTVTNTTMTSSGHKISCPPSQNQHEVPQWLKEETETNMMSKIMPKFVANKPCEYWRLCWDAITPTQDWVLDKHPDARLSNLYFAIGGSFHSYKFLPNAGVYMANVLMGTGNGPEKDKRWAWKKGIADWDGAHQKTFPKRELGMLA